MRKGISLIELIFTIVIIAVVFTVIPKIVFALSKSDEFAIKQDALFNGMTMMQMISRLSWDESNTDGNASNDILIGMGISADINLTCQSNNYRKGGFFGSRNCEHNASVIVNIGPEIGESRESYDDVDDFHTQSVDINTSKITQIYDINITAKYIKDTIGYSGQKASIILDKNSTGIIPPTNLKLVDVNVTYQGKRGASGTPITQFSYVSANIGKFFIAKRTW